MEKYDGGILVNLDWLWIASKHEQNPLNQKYVWNNDCIFLNHFGWACNHGIFVRSCFQSWILALNFRILNLGCKSWIVSFQNTFAELSNLVFPGSSGKVPVWGSGGIFTVGFIERLARNLCIIILLHFGLISFRCHFPKLRKVIILMICRPSGGDHDF